MPSLYNDQSIPALVWRGATKDGQFNLNRLRHESFKVIPNMNRNGVLMHMPNTSLGKRNGVPDGQEDQILHLQKLQGNPYPTGKSPFLNDSVEHMFPRTYSEANPMGGTNGTIRNVSSIGGTPLAIALDDGTEILQRVHNEKFRMHPDNPLSAEFALNAFVARGQEPELGPVSNFMRLGLAHDAEDAYILNGKMAAGFLREELNNLPLKMAEKLKEKNELHLSKLNQDVKNVESRQNLTDPTGILDGGDGNLNDRMEDKKQTFQQFTHANGDGPSSSSFVKNPPPPPNHSQQQEAESKEEYKDPDPMDLHDLFDSSEKELESLLSSFQKGPFGATKPKGRQKDPLDDTFDGALGGVKRSKDFDVEDQILGRRKIYPNPIGNRTFVQEEEMKKKKVNVELPTYYKSNPKGYPMKIMDDPTLLKKADGQHNYTFNFVDGPFSDFKGPFENPFTTGPFFDDKPKPKPSRRGPFSDELPTVTNDKKRKALETVNVSKKRRRIISLGEKRSGVRSIPKVGVKGPFSDDWDGSYPDSTPKPSKIKSSAPKGPFSDDWDGSYPDSTPKPSKIKSSAPKGPFSDDWDGSYPDSTPKPPKETKRDKSKRSPEVQKFIDARMRGGEDKKFALKNDVTFI